MSIKEKRTVAATYLTEVYCSMTLEDYKKQASNLMKGYENIFQGYLDDGWAVPMIETAVLYNY